MKKNLMLCAIALAGLLTGCGGDNNPPTPPIPPVNDKGEITNPYNFEELLEVASKLAEGESNNKEVYTVATVVEGKDTNHNNTPLLKDGRVTFTVGNGTSSMLVYNANTCENKANFAEAMPVKVGDEVLFCGAIKNYKGTLEVCYIKDVAECKLLKVNGEEAKGDHEIPPSPPSLTVKKSELKAVYEEIESNIYGEEYEADDACDYDEELHTYYDDVEWCPVGELSWEDCIYDFITCLPTSAVEIISPQEGEWDDGEKCVETAYVVDSYAYVEAATRVEDDTIYVQFNVMPNDGYEFVDDDDQPKVKTTSLDFTNLSFSGNLYDSAPNKSFVDYINDQQKEELVKSVESNASQIYHFQQNGKDYINRVMIGSGSTGDTIKFNFAYPVSKITVVASAYWKYIEYSKSYSIDMDAAMYINNDAIKMDITPENNTSEPKTDTKTIGFETPVTSISFYNKDAKQRSFILSLEVTYTA